MHNPDADPPEASSKLYQENDQLCRHINNMRFCQSSVVSWQVVSPHTNPASGVWQATILLDGQAANHNAT